MTTPPNVDVRTALNDQAHAASLHFDWSAFDADRITMARVALRNGSQPTAGNDRRQAGMTKALNHLDKVQKGGDNKHIAAARASIAKAQKASAPAEASYHMQEAHVLLGRAMGSDHIAAPTGGGRSSFAEDPSEESMNFSWDAFDAARGKLNDSSASPKAKASYHTSMWKAHARAQGAMNNQSLASRDAHAAAGEAHHNAAAAWKKSDPNATSDKAAGLLSQKANDATQKTSGASKGLAQPGQDAYSAGEKGRQWRRYSGTGKLPKFAEDTEHTHAKVGGGTATHSHPGGDDAHKHPEKYALLPLPGDGPANLLATNSEQTSHTHAKVGGGTSSHDHPGGDGPHKHESKFNLLPLPGKGPAPLMGANMAEADATEFGAPCPDCNGTGKIDGKECELCGGTGDAPASTEDVAVMAESKGTPDDACTKCGGDGKMDDGTECTLCGGSGNAADATSENGDPGEVRHDGKKAKMSETSLFSLAPVEAVEFAEGKPLPFLAVGRHTFPQFAHLVPGGVIDVTRARLAEVKKYFDENGRRQDLPVINEAHDAHRAIGWIKSMDWDGPDRLSVVPDWNPVGAKLMENDEYRYVSPELLVNWTDPELGTTYPMIGSGLALTNVPKMKNLGRIAASEDDGCSLIACSEVSAASPYEARRLLMLAEDDPDGDGDDDGTVPLCMYQPPVANIGCCPGYTRRQGDTDGDGTCQFADNGCNGYRPAPAGVIAQLMGNSSRDAVSPYMSEIPTLPMPYVTTTGTSNNASFVITNPQGATHMAEPTETPDQAPTEPDGDVVADKAEAADKTADKAAVAMAETKAKDLEVRFAESETRATALAAKFAESETSRLELAEKVAKMEREKVVATTRAEFSEYLRKGQITPAEIELLIPDDDAVVKMAELPSVLASIAARKPTIDFTERGIEGDADAVADPNAATIAMAEKLRETKPTLTTEQAYVAALKADPKLAEAALGAPSTNTSTRFA